MANIRETLTLEDRFSANFTRYIQMGQQAAGASDLASASARNYQSVANSLDRQLIVLNSQFAALAQNQQALADAGQDGSEAFQILEEEMNTLGGRIRNVQTQYSLVVSEMEQAQSAAANAATATDELAESQNRASTSSNSLIRQLKNLFGAYIGIQGIKSLFNLSDTFASNTARLNMMNDGLLTTEQLTDRIYEAAQRSRGSYQATTEMVAKLGTLAGDAFSSTSEIVDFAEQLNKQIALSGASTQAADSAMLQLTQAMSSGLLRGEELNSILEQTPTIAQTIADYMGVTTGEMRELASEGAITGEVVKNALLGAAGETNAAFESMPMTWGQVWVYIKNFAIKAMEPVLSAVNSLANKVGTAIQWVRDNMALIEPVLAMLAAGAIAVGVSMLWAGLTAAAGWIAANWPILVVIAAIGALIFTARQAGATFQEIGEVIGGVLGALYAVAMNECIVPLQNAFAAIANFLGNVFNDPVAAIKVLFFDMALTVLGHIKNIAQGIESLINNIPGLSVNITSGVDRVYNMVQQASQAVKDESGWKEYVKAWDYVDYEGAIKGGSEIGSKLGSALDNLDLTGGLDSLLNGSGPWGSYPSYDDMQNSLDGIGGSVSNIEKSVKMSDEDLKSLVDMAERRYVNKINLTAQTPVINIRGANTGATAADRKALADAIQTVLMEQLASTSVRATAIPT